VIVTSELVTIDGFLGPLTVSISAGSAAEFSIDDGAWTTAPTAIEAGQAVRVRHLSSATIGEAVETSLSIALDNGASRTTGVFRTVTSEADSVPDAFDFGEQLDVPGDTLIESVVLTLTGFNLPAAIECGPHAEYRIDAGVWTSEPGLLQPEQTLQMRHVSNSPGNSMRNTHIHVGGVTGYFRTRTKAKR
jgi:hypothetical protein